MAHPIEQDLRTNAAALRGLARALVGPNDADDLLQDAAVQALQVDQPRSFAALLHRILRHLAHKQRRANARRARHEAQVAPPTETAPPDRIAEHRESLRRVTDALLALPEPWQGTVMLRFFEALPPSAIAARTGVPLPTVKSRLQRGLELLRADLDRDGDDWRPALAAAFGLERATAAAITTGVLLMGSGVKLTIAGAAAVFAVAATLYFAGGAPGAAGDEAIGAVDPPAMRVPTDIPRVHATAAAAAPDRIAATPDAEAPARIIGRCVDTDGRPLAGCTVHIDTAPNEPPLAADQTTGADGTFAFELQGGIESPRTLCFSGQGFVSMRPQAFALLPASRHDVGDITMYPGTRIQGRVVDSLGEPCPGVGVYAQQPGSMLGTTWLLAAAATTGADGTFTTTPCLPGHHQLGVQRELLLRPQTLTTTAGEHTHTVEIVIEAKSRLPSIQGVVVDARGDPVAAAIVHTEEPGYGSSFANADAEGRFCVYRTVTGSPLPAQLRVRAGHDEATVAETVAWGTTGLHVVLKDLLVLDIDVVDEAGRAVEDFAVRVTPAYGGRSAHAFLFKPQQGGHHQGGHLRVTDLSPISYQLRVEPKDAALFASRITPFEIVPPGPALLRVVLPRRASRTLQVKTPSGKPVQGCRVELCEPFVREVTLLSRPVPPQQWRNAYSPEDALLLQSQATAASGELELCGPAATALVLRLLGPGCQPQLVAGVRLDEPAPLRVVVQPGGTLRVRATPVEVLQQLAALSTPGSHGDIATSLGLTRRVGDHSELLPRASEPPMPLTADGTLQWSGIPPGTWQIVLRHGLLEARCEQPLQSVTVQEGEPTEVELDLSALAPATLRGHVTREGNAAANQMLLLKRYRYTLPRGQRMWEEFKVMSDGHGDFTFRGLSGRYLLTLYADAWEHRFRSQEGEFELSAGATRAQTFAFATGGILVRVVDADGKPVQGVKQIAVFREAWDFVVHLPTTDADGRAVWPLCEAGTFQLSVLPSRLDAAEARVRLMSEHPEDPNILTTVKLDLGTVTVRPGKPVEQTVLLPAAYFE